jgi:bifunctional non-homologous end joining protein LigD
LLRQESFNRWPKVTGGKGLHVVAPVDREMDWTGAKAFTRGIAEHRAAARPIAIPPPPRGRNGGCSSIGKNHRDAAPHATEAERLACLDKPLNKPLGTKLAKVRTTVLMIVTERPMPP